MDSFAAWCRTILPEIDAVLDKMSEREVSALLTEVTGAEKVFVVGAGRVGLVMSAFAKRLNHCLVPAFVVGEPTNPNTTPRDLLLVSSGSGETATIVAVARRAKDASARIALITAHPDSTIGKLADTVLVLPAPTKLHRQGERRSVQPMTNLFEQCLYVTCDVLALMIQQQRGISERELWERHANLE